MRDAKKLLIIKSENESLFSIVVFEFVGVKIGKSVAIMKTLPVGQRLIYVPYADREDAFKIYSVACFATDVIQEVDSTSMPTNDLVRIFNATL